MKVAVTIFENYTHNLLHKLNILDSCISDIIAYQLLKVSKRTNNIGTNIWQENACRLST